MAQDDDRDDLEERLDRLEATLDELRDAVAEPGTEAGRAERPTGPPGSDRALRLAERLAVPAAVGALEANVRLLEFLQDRLRELEEREPAGRAGTGELSGRALDRLDDALVRLEDALADADLPQDAEARRLLERARDLNDEVRSRVAGPDAAPSGPGVVEIDVEAELDQLKEDVEDEASGDGDDEAEGS